MDLKQIKELMAAMGKNGCTKLAIKNEGFEISLERADATPIPSSDMPANAIEENLFRKDMAIHRAKMAHALREGTGQEIAPAAGHLAENEAKDDKPSAYIHSPMVGTYYHSPSPQDPPFVKVGDKIEKNDVVCIIEAMKVMNEIKATVTGTIVEVLVDNGSPVEFGAKLFRII